MSEIPKIFSTLFYLGYIKWAPGTIGSLLSIIIIILLHNFLNKIVFIIFFIFIFVLAIIFVSLYSKSINKHDASEIVIDEFLGIYLIMIFSYNSILVNDFLNIFLIFILFRFFDITKPYPINWINSNIKNSYGIILDDILAGIYTIITLTILNAFI